MSRLSVASMVVLLFVVASCSVGGDAMRSRLDSDVVAGPGEPSFVEYYGLKLSLPIGEDKFCSILDNHGIEFRILDRAHGDVLPIPRQRQDLGLTKFNKMYEIFAGVDGDQSAGRRFRAYVDGHNVVYIENAFSYPGL